MTLHGNGCITPAWPGFQRWGRPFCFISTESALRPVHSHQE